MKKRQAVSVILLVAIFLLQPLACTRNNEREPETAVPPTTPLLTTNSEITDSNEVVTAVAAASQMAVYSEAPSLAEQVSQAELPAVNERLPANPMLIQPENEVGVYGGSLTVPVPIIGLRLSFIAYEPLVRWDAQWLRVIPNVAQVVDSSADATTYTFHLREGMRWSDGELFTADDIIFWYEAVFSNAELTARVPGWLSTNGVPVSVSKIDGETVTFRFAEPNSLFLYNLAGMLGQNLTRHPQHYLAQFHPAYNADVDRLVAEEGAADWVALFQSKSDFTNPDLPTLNGWVVSEVGDGRITATRNPYYWKVDTEFNQLPYIDQVVFTEVDSLADYELQTQANTAHLILQDEFEDDTLSAELRENSQQITLISSFSSDLVIALNLNHADPILRQIFQELAFRQALSHALNRQRMIETLFGGTGESYQVAPRPESPYYQEKLARQFTEYDPTLANTLLDQAGYSERDEAGFRLRPDGQRITVHLQTPNATHLPILNLVQEDWQAVAIDAPVVVYADTNEHAQALFNNQHDTYISEGVGGLDVLLQPVYYFPLHPFASWYATGWGQWYVDPDNPSAIVPPELVQQQMALYDQLKSTVDPDEQVVLMAQILEIAAAQFYVIGTVLQPNQEMLISQNLRNVAEVMPLSVVDYPTPGPSNPAQYFIAPANEK